MEAKIRDIQPVGVADSWARQEQRLQEPQSIQPVPKNEGSQTKKAGEEKKERSQGALKSESSSDEVRSLVRDVQDYLSELNIDLSFQVNDKTKEVVVKVLNAGTGELIRQIPPEDLVKFREKLRELRGVLFEGKA